MNIWLLSALFLSSCCYATHDAQYECGPHGRFEYCIDGIPGCVIGCHCHPGYYFDTDSKICEPNIKLRQDYRRHYLSEPTRVQVPPLTNVFTSTTNPVDDKIDEITKDASDLGDWLYNQFFKTIENQVINNTNDNEQILTRRSGSIPIKKKPKRKNRKYLRKSDKKRKNKKSGLEKKLLRITEDDSLFDSSSTSSSDETSSSSRESNSGDTSSENEKNKDHGHKKILIYNKKPKPSLPSFIFLPNMDTPFYPPIGIPPPPALPMYPMVPVPPMGPMFPYPPGTTPNCENSNEKSTKSVTTADSKISSSQASVAPMTTKHEMTRTESTTLSTPETPALSTQDPGVPENQDSSPAERNLARSKHHDQSGAYSKKEKWLKGRPNRRPQINLLQKIKQKLKKKNKVTPVEHLINTQNVDEPFLDSNYLQNSVTSHKKQMENFEEDTPMEDVDFKYITELIHRANNTKHALKLPSNDVFVGIPRPLTNRRNYYHNSDNIPQPNLESTITDHRPMRRPQESDDSYYTNLGRQIASLIRNIDTQGQHQLNIEIERSKQPITTSQPFFDENVYAPRSYWDRLIRSTEKKYYPLFLKNSNENLIDVENKVKYAVSTILPLSLHELENIINEIKHTHNEAKSDHNTGLTQKLPPVQFRYKLFRKPLNTQNREDIREKIMNNAINISKIPENRERNKNIHSKFYSELLNNMINIVPSSDDSTRSKTNIPKSLVITPTRRFFNHSALKIPLFNHLQFLKTIHNIPLKSTVKKSDTTFQVNPMKLNHKNLNYYPSNNNQFMYQKSAYPIYFLDNTRKLYQPLDKSVKPSYFHHELHHFDYFDN